MGWLVQDKVQDGKRRGNQNKGSFRLERLRGKCRRFVLRGDDSSWRSFLKGKLWLLPIMIMRRRGAFLEKYLVGKLKGGIVEI